MNKEADSAECTLARSYDMTPYAGNPFYHTHPSVLAAYGVMYGLSPSAPGNCRVLELGCADGGNIVPMAHDFPNSRFLGIDLSAVQIGMGQKRVDALGLKNIQLKTRSIMDVDATDGKFDYIIVHGVYSWVPDEVRQKILDICSNNLATQGIAHISYNVLPGWQFNQSMRDMMLYRTRHLKNPKERADTALGLITTMLQATADDTGIHDVQLRFFGKGLKSYQDVTSYLLHEYMEADNVPFYFHEFADDLNNHGLQYICDADQPDFELDSLPGDIGAEFEKIAENAIEVEQYIDFLKNTRFRRSLVCHAGLEVTSDYRLDRLQPLFAATDVVPILDTPDSPVGEATAFRTTAGRRFSTQHHLAQVLLRKLSEIKPTSIAIPALIETLAGNAAVDPALDGAQQAEKIGNVLYSLFFNGVVELLGAGRRCILDGGEFPKVSPIARLMVQSRRVTNLCHRTVVMDDDMALYVLSHLDGTRNRDALCDLMLEGVRNGQVHLPKRPKKSTGDTRAAMYDQLESIFKQLPRCGVLMS